MQMKQIRWEALFADGWREVSVEDLLFRLIGSGLIRAYRAKH
jgi:hypothetical protein